MDNATALPEGAYWKDDMLYGPSGDVLPDGLYVDSEGNYIMFEGNFGFGAVAF